MITKEVIDGVLKLVQYIHYSNKSIKRVINPNTMIPEEVIVLN